MAPHFECTTDDNFRQVEESNPDQGKEGEECEDTFQKINQIANVLIKSEMRKAYDSDPHAFPFPVPADEGQQCDGTVEGTTGLRLRAAKTSTDNESGQTKVKTDEPSFANSEAVWSSGVPFYPPSRKYWRIGGKWYDFKTFLDKHPGGANVLLLSRDRFEDCTFVFEAHHHNYKRARAAIQKYEVSEETVIADGLMARPARGTKAAAHHDKDLDGGASVKLLDDSAFYSVMRERVTAHLRSVGCLAGGPTRSCLTLFWIIFVLWIAGWAGLLYTGSFWMTPVLGLISALLGAFGHNWVHQPKYKLLAYLSLDTIGFSSDGWFREHNLQHHMYTNTPWDNHFKGTDPFLVTDPTVERNFVQQYIMPYAHPVILCFGLWGNYVAHLTEILHGNEAIRPTKLILPLQVCLAISGWGLYRGVALVFTMYAVMSLHYFTLALMNHNAEHCMDVRARNAARDFGEAQLNSSADWGVNLSFYRASIYLWLNYHTVHHMFPRIDFSHHGDIQQILIKTCKEFDVKYSTGTFRGIYKEMVYSFSTPQSLMQEVLVQSGGI